MEQNSLYIIESTKTVVTGEYRHSVMMLTKVLFRLNVIDEEQALKMATNFRILFV